MNYASSPWFWDLENTKKIKWWKASSFVLQAKVITWFSHSTSRASIMYRGHSNGLFHYGTQTQSYPTYESTLGKGSWVPLMHHEKSDLGSLTLIWIIPKECTLRFSWLKKKLFTKPCRGHGWEFRSSLMLFSGVISSTATLCKWLRAVIIILTSNWYFMVLTHRHALRIFKNLV